MRRRRKRFPVFIGFLILSILIFLLSQYGWFSYITSLIQSATIPLQRSSFSLLQKDDDSKLTKLKNENRELLTQLVKLKALEKDNQALRDQFIVTKPAPFTLIPAFIVGMPTFLPGITSVDNMNIDKGSMDNVKIGNEIVFKDNLVGSVVKTSPHISIVELLNHKNSSFTAQTMKTEAAGIIKGTGDKNLILSNVSLNDTLQLGDMVITKDPNPLIVGKIISINKKPSSLFQTAEVERLVDITKLKVIFVLVSSDH